MKRLPLLAVISAFCVLAFGQAAEKPGPDLNAVRDEILSNTAPEGNPQTTTVPPKKQAEDILSNPLYREKAQTETQESWLNRALEDLGEWLSKFFQNKEQKPGPQPGGLFQAAGYVIQLVIYLLLAALVGFLIFMLAKVRLNKKVSASDEEGLVTAEEAKRSADQWLTEADRLSKLGEYRAAVRCLYLACLNRLDESRILRFERHETNWEHLHRFRDLTSKPGQFDLTPVTQRFDQAWYGLVPQSVDDVEWFKTEYQQLLKGIREAKS